MKNFRALIYYVVLLFCLFHKTNATEKKSDKIIWNELSSFTPLTEASSPEGLSGCISGMHEDIIFLAGGSNFETISLLEGGQKKYHNTCYILKKNSQNEYEWNLSGVLPYPVAHGVSFSTSKGIITVGGMNEEGHLSNVLLISWNKEKQCLDFYDLPSLPYTCAYMAGALADNKIYILGGYINGEVANSVSLLDLTKWGNTDWGWEKAENFPGTGRLQPVACAQSNGEENSIYLFGGYYPGSETEEFTYFTDPLIYLPSSGKWEIIKSGTKHFTEYPLVGTSALPIGSSHILFTGSVDKEKFLYEQQLTEKINKTSATGNKDEEEKYKQQRIDYWNQPASYFNFNPSVFVYHTITNTWATIGEIPSLPVVASSIVPIKEGFIIIGGEIKPGVRTGAVYKGQIYQTIGFGWINYTVVAAYLMGMLWLGYFFMKRTNGTNDFFTGGQRIPWWAAGISIFATALSAITFLSIPAKAYTTDWRMLIFNFAIILVVPIVVKYYLPFFRKLNTSSAYQYLELRFNKMVRYFGSSLFCIFMLTRIAVVLFLPSLALNAVSGIDIYLCILLMGIITTIYCTMGGVEAVIWGDVVQGIVLVGGAVVSLIYMIYGSDGGFAGFFHSASEAGKFQTFDFRFDFTQPVLWVALLGGLANQLIAYTSDQSVIQRYMTTRNEKMAAKSIWFNGVISLPVSIIFFLIGTALYVFYKSNSQLLDIQMSNADAIFPHFMVTELPAGVSGLLIAAVFSAAMSTLSSNINSISTAVTEDFFQQIKKDLTEKNRMVIARVSGLLGGVIGTGFALGLATWEINSLWDQFNVFLGLLTSGLGGLFVMGIFTKRINSTCAVIGLTSSMILLLIIRSHTNISFLLFGFIGLVSSFIIAYISSFIFHLKLK